MTRRCWEHPLGSDDRLHPQVRGPFRSGVGVLPRLKRLPVSWQELLVFFLKNNNNNNNNNNSRTFHKVKKNLKDER